MVSVSNLNNKADHDEENDLFYFESEHLALRGNKEYSELLKTIAILEAQRAGAIKDIDKIIEIQKCALEDPVEFIQKIRNKEDLGIPTPQRIAEISSINWSQYDVPVPEEAFELINQEKIEDNRSSRREPKKPKSNTYSETFNKPWTSEEQKKLEELLVQFPPEPIEMRRYKKIAEALGNRTVKQVTSRVQKYFLKLHKAGLPVPGRIPKYYDRKKSYSHRHQRHNVYLYKPSTFFPDLEVPVHMPENDDEGTSSTQIQTVEPTIERSDLEVRINLLKRIKTEKKKQNFASSTAHIGFRCDKCDEEPIVGIRWHCNTCVKESIDFCTDCVVIQVQNNENDVHPLRHNLQPITILDADDYSDLQKDKIDDLNEIDSSSSDEQNDTNSNMYDQDYVNGDSVYNYLDPNFLPE